MGLYPNVCVHRDKRRLISSDNKCVLIHKSSINNIVKDPRFSSPYFVFGEKVVSLNCICILTHAYTKSIIYM